MGRGADHNRRAGRDHCAHWPSRARRRSARVHRRRPSRRSTASRPTWPRSRRVHSDDPAASRRADGFQPRGVARAGRGNPPVSYGWHAVAGKGGQMNPRRSPEPGPAEQSSISRIAYLPQTTAPRRLLKRRGAAAPRCVIHALEYHALRGPAADDGGCRHDVARQKGGTAAPPTRPHRQAAPSMGSNNTATATVTSDHPSMCVTGRAPRHDMTDERQGVKVI